MFGWFLCFYDFWKIISTHQEFWCPRAKWLPLIYTHEQKNNIWILRHGHMCYSTRVSVPVHHVKKNNQDRRIKANNTTSRNFECWQGRIHMKVALNWTVPSVGSNELWSWTSSLVFRGADRTRPPRAWAWGVRPKSFCAYSDYGSHSPTVLEGSPGQSGACCWMGSATVHILY